MPLSAKMDEEVLAGTGTPSKDMPSLSALRVVELCHDQGIELVLLDKG
jgi:hypothetical protein